MPILLFKKVDPIEELDAEVLLADKLTALQKKNVAINASVIKQGSVTFRGTVGTNTMSIIAEFKARVLADGGTIEAYDCLYSELQKLALL